MTPFKTLLQTLSSDGKDFEKLTKWYFENHPEWAAQVESVWLWDDYPQRWGRDCGIDLIVRLQNGQEWAVQSKNYADTYYVSKHDVDKFISESGRSSIHGRILVATTDKLGENAIQCIEGQEKPFETILLTDLVVAPVDWPNSIKDLTKVQPQIKYQPLKHQEDAIKAASQGLRKNDRITVAMACRSGKSFVGRWIAESVDAQRSLVLVPTLNLVSQLQKDWRKASTKPYQSLIVCSDYQTGQDGEEEKVSFPVPVTQDPNEIAAFLNGEGEKVIFATYQSSFKLDEAQRLGAKPFDLSICDEAHNLAGAYTDQKDYSAILSDSRIISKKRVFMTATPRDFTEAQQTRAEEKGIQVASMNNEEIFGKCVFTYSFRQAINDGITRPYKVVIALVTDEDLQAKIQSRAYVDLPFLTDAINAKDVAFSTVLSDTMKQYDLHKGITFHSRNNSAATFGSIFKQISAKSNHQVVTGNIHSDLNSYERHNILRLLDTSHSSTDAIITNCRVLTEGVTVPDCDFVSLVDPKKSSVSIIQAISRTLCKTPGKDYGYVILPVFVEKGETPEDIIRNGRFKDAIYILNRLAEEDEVMKEQINQLRISLGPERLSRTVDAGIEIIEFVGGTPMQLKEFKVGLQNYIIDRMLGKAYDDFESIKNYVDKFLKFPSFSYVDDRGTKLGLKVQNARNGNYPSLQMLMIQEYGEENFFTPHLFKAKNLYIAIKKEYELTGKIGSTVYKDPIFGCLTNAIRNARNGQNPYLKTLLENSDLPWEDPWENNANKIFDGILFYKKQTGGLYPPQKWEHPTYGKVGQALSRARRGRNEKLAILLDSHPETSDWKEKNPKIRPFIQLV